MGQCSHPWHNAIKEESVHILLELIIIPAGAWSYPWVCVYVYLHSVSCFFFLYYVSAY